MLVRDDTHRFLRGSDLKDGGDGDELYLHDPKQGIVPAPGRSLALDGLEPSLEGRFEAKLANGKKVAVRPVFELLREHLAAYTPEKAAAMSGTPASQIQDLARRLAKAKSASMVTTSNFAKYYHGNLIERTQALVFALTGQFGKKGSGFVGFPFLMHDGLDKWVLSAFGLGMRGLIGAYGLYEETRSAAGRLHRRDDDLRAQPQELRGRPGVLRLPLLVRARRHARGEREAAGLGPAPETAGARGARRIAVQGLAVRLAQARQRSARHVLAGEQSAAPPARLPAAAEERCGRSCARSSPSTGA